jgi:hypothetical protein
MRKGTKRSAYYPKLDDRISEADTEQILRAAMSRNDQARISPLVIKECRHALNLAKSEYTRALFDGLEEPPYHRRNRMRQIAKAADWLLDALGANNGSSNDDKSPGIDKSWDYVADMSLNVQIPLVRQKVDQDGEYFSIFELIEDIQSMRTRALLAAASADKKLKLKGKRNKGDVALLTFVHLLAKLWCRLGLKVTLGRTADDVPDSPFIRFVSQCLPHVNQKKSEQSIYEYVEKVRELEPGLIASKK